MAIKKLDVYLHSDFVGQLTQDESGQIIFDYDKNWLSSPKAVPLSHSLPLQKDPFRSKACRGFFAGILPEESKREMVARNLGISKQNDFAILEKIGGECAGAVTFIPAGNKLPSAEHSYRALSDHELAEILKILPNKPLMAGEEGIRLSLAGAQDKIAVYVAESKISIPQEGAPSTHILKPAIENFEGLVFNEAFCLKLARAIGLPSANAEIYSVEGIDYLLVARYDRITGTDGVTHRLHQEDFCQALGVPSETKYQSEDGPSLKACFALLREVSSAPVIDLQHLLDGVIFNLLIGNHDAHGKNFSILYDRVGNARLSPFYDLLSTVYYPELTKKMAMKIGKEYESDKIYPHDFELLATDAGLAKPMVKRRVGELAERVMGEVGKKGKKKI